MASLLPRASLSSDSESSSIKTEKPSQERNPIQDILKDPAFYRLSSEEKKQVFSAADPDFSAASPEDQDSVIQHVSVGSIGIPVSRELAQDIAASRLVQSQREAGKTDIFHIDEIAPILRQEGYDPSKFGKVVTLGQTPAAVRNAIERGIVSGGTFGLGEAAIASRERANLSPIELAARGREAIMRESPPPSTTLGILPKGGYFTAGEALGAAALPTPKAIQGGTVLNTALRSALFGGAGAGTYEASREIAENQPLQPSNITASTLGGATLGAALPLALGALTKIPAVAGSVKRAFQRAGINAAASQEAKNVEKTLAQGAVDTVSAANKEAASAGQAVDKNLPSLTKKAVDSAIKNGVEQPHVALFNTANPEEAQIANQLVKESEAHAKLKTSRDPQLTVGEQVKKRIQDLEEIRKDIGAEQGRYMEDLNASDIANPQSAILKRMNEVPGLNGIKVSPKGQLDFTDTTLSSSLTDSERNTIQNLFNDVKGRSPFQLHKLRQEIFEDLGGKKASLSKLTDTQEKGLESIRQGIADVLEEANPYYKQLNQKYAEVARPLTEIRKHFKNIEGASDDILDLKGSLLARRLTSNAVSNPELRGILQNVEDALAKNGKPVGTDVVKIQEFLNAIKQYYPEIKPGTSLEGILSGSLKEAPMKLAKKATGITPDVRRYYLKNLIDTLAKQPVIKAAPEVSPTAESILERSSKRMTANPTKGPPRATIPVEGAEQESALNRAILERTAQQLAEQSVAQRVPLEELIAQAANRAKAQGNINEQLKSVILGASSGPKKMIVRGKGLNEPSIPANPIETGMTEKELFEFLRNQRAKQELLNQMAIEQNR